jgi:hypothetical protein
MWALGEVWVEDVRVVGLVPAELARKSLRPSGFAKAYGSAVRSPCERF